MVINTNAIVAIHQTVKVSTTLCFSVSSGTLCQTPDSPASGERLAIVNAGMSVKFEDGTDTIKELQMFYGSVGPTVVSASKTCQQLIGRYVITHLKHETQALPFFKILMKIALGKFF